MATRDYILNNFRWKLLALGLAVFAWFSIQSAKDRSVDHIVLRDRPINILRPPGDSTIYRVNPPTVSVTLRADPGVLQRVSDRDVHVFVNLTIVPEVSEVYRRVLIFAPEGVSARPDNNNAVSVVKLLPSVESLTNNFNQP